MNPFRCLGMHERYANASQEAKRNKALFRIVKPVIFKCECRAGKDILGISEIQTVKGQISSSLGFVPCQSHLQTAYT